jgi:hypothetical protein
MNIIQILSTVTYEIILLLQFPVVEICPEYLMFQCLKFINANKLLQLKPDLLLHEVSFYSLKNRH